MSKSDKTRKERRYTSDREYEQITMNEAKLFIDWMEATIPYCKERVHAREQMRQVIFWCNEAHKLYGDDDLPLDEWRD
jgi:hypothetical protein